VLWLEGNYYYLFTWRHIYYSNCWYLRTEITGFMTNWKYLTIALSFLQTPFQNLMILVFYCKREYRNLINCWSFKCFKYSIWKIKKSMLKHLSFNKQHIPVITKLKSLSNSEINWSHLFCKSDIPLKWHMKFNQYFVEKDHVLFTMSIECIVPQICYPLPFLLKYIVADCPFGGIYVVFKYNNTFSKQYVMKHYIT